MGTRYDVSEVPLQGGYVAKWCPVKAQNDTLQPCEPLLPSPSLERRFERGRDFEDGILEQLKVLHPDLVVIDHELRGEAAEEATLSAMNDGSTLIFGGRLPSDLLGRRVGKPDLLVRADSSGYRAVDVKHHLTLKGFEKESALCAPLEDPRWEGAAEEPSFSPRKRREDLLQLAHYQRMLEAAGLAAEDRRGAIIGVESRATWFNLDAPLWKTPSSSGKQKPRTTMEVYDFEFDFRLDVIAVAQQHLSDPSVKPLLVPVKIGACGECPWWGHCGPQLEAGSGDVSLLPNLGWKPWSIHRAHGTKDRAALARLDHRTATLVASGIDVRALMDQAQLSPPSTPVAEIIGGRRPAQVTRLQAAGVTTAADVMNLCEETASYSGSGLTSLAAQIDLARASLGPQPAYRRRDVERIEVPRADVELDIDLENVEEGVYLWGCLVTDRAGAGVEGGYRAFAAWEPMTQEAEVAIFDRLWKWLTLLRAETRSAGKSFRAYCYNEGVESGHLRRLAALADRSAEVEELVGSKDWVDLLRVFDKQLITGGRSGLKTTAPVAGYEWPVEEPGGAKSMLLYDRAVSDADPQEREQAQTWLLDYNRGDVEATLALREWMDRDGSGIPGIETVLPEPLLGP